MIKLYTWGTPNGKKVSIMLEEIGMPYEVYPINIGKNDQFKPEYLAINPNNKIPSIIDTEGPGGKPFTLFESGAILMYLAEKSGKFWPADLRAALSGDSVADVSDGRSRTHVRPGQLFLPPRRKSSLRHRTFSQRSAAVCIACSTKSWASANIWPGNTRSPTSRPIPGSDATRGIT